MASNSAKGKKRKGSSSAKKPKFPILDELINFDDEELYLSIVGYGKQGRGKTTFAGTAPNPVILDFNERGTLSIRGKGIQGWRIEEWERVEEVYWYLHSGEHNFETVVWDTGTQAADVCLEWVLGVQSQYDSSAGVMVSRQDWGNMSKHMKYWITKFRNLPMHKIFLFQEKSLDEDDVDEGSPLVVPMVSPAVRETVCAAVDIIARFEYVEKKKKVGKGDRERIKRVPTYRMRIGPSATYHTKFRTPDGVVLPEDNYFIENPTFEKVLALYKTLNS